RTDLRRAARVGRLPVVQVVDGDVPAGGVLEQPLERLVARQPRVRIELRRQHLDARARGADAELDIGASEHLDQAGGVRRARSARYAEEDAHCGSAGVAAAPL